MNTPSTYTPQTAYASSAAATDIATLLPWGEPKRVGTRNGDRLLRKAPATEAFWGLWRANKPTLQAAGISVGKQGANWEVCWWSPLDPAEAAAKRKQFEAEQEERRRADAGLPATLSEELEAKFMAVAPKLLPYQLPSVRRQVKALTDYGGAMDASDTGTGKTYVNLATCAVLGKPVFVVCPKAVKTSWRRACGHFGIEPVGVENYELLRESGTPFCDVSFKTVKKLVKGKEVSKRVFESATWRLAADTIIIFDEMHRCKDHTTLNAQLGFAAIRQGYKVLGLSATAADNPMQMKFAALLTRQIQNEKQFFGWMIRNGVSKGRFGFEFNGGQAALHRIHMAVFPLHGTRIKIADLGDAFPETQIAPELYEMNGATADINAVYEDMAEEIAAIAQSELSDAEKHECILTVRLRAHQRAEILKVPALADRIKDAVEEGMSVAAFVNFDATLDALAARLKVSCLVRGGQSQAERDAAVDAFQADKEHVILCNIKAGGVGIGLHGTPTARMRCSFVFPSDSAQDVKQAFGRVWRAKGARSIQRLFCAAGTIEEDIYANFMEKAGRIDTLNDGDFRLKGGGEYLPEAPKEQPAQTTSVLLQPAAELSLRRQGDAGAEAKVLVDKLTEEGRKLLALPQVMEAIRGGLRTLAGLDPDHAGDRNDVGFNGGDSFFGHRLAELATLSPRQAAIARKMLLKYHRQIPAEVAVIKARTEAA